MRLRDWKEVYEDFPAEHVQTQAGRCMDCGIPFCNNGCPLGNLIPDWNDLVYRDHWRDAIDRLHATNNFPEFTGRLCPAPCEAACVLGINADPVTIKQVEVEIIDRAWDEGWVKPQMPSVKTGKRVAVIGSGPAGLAAAQQLTRAGHDVWCSSGTTASAACCATASPSSRWRSATSSGASPRWRPRAPSSAPTPGSATRSTSRSCSPPTTPSCSPAGPPRGATCRCPGASCGGIHQAMEYLPWSNRVQEGDLDEPPITAEGKHVVIIGGGDTGADCLGTAHRQGAASITQLEILPRPPDERAPSNPWPQWSLIYRTSSAHEEGGERVFSVNTERFVDDGAGNVRALLIHEVELRRRPLRRRSPGTERELPADLVLLAMGFVGPEQAAWLERLGVEFDERGNVRRDDDFMTNVPGVFVAGDMGRGQ